MPLYENFQGRYDWSIDFSPTGVKFGTTTLLNLPPKRTIFKTTSPVLIVQHHGDNHTIVFDKTGKNVFEWDGNSRANYIVRVSYNKKGKRTGWSEGL